MKIMMMALVTEKLAYSRFFVAPSPSAPCLLSLVLVSALLVVVLLCSMNFIVGCGTQKCESVAEGSGTIYKRGGDVTFKAPPYVRATHR